MQSAPETYVETRLVIGPNASLTGPQAGIFFGSLCLVAFGIAGFFAVQGLWPVLPFAGLEVAALGAALRVALWRNRYREIITFAGDRVTVETGVLGSGARAREDLRRAPTRAILEPGPHPTSPTRLVLSCSGRRLEIGRCLTDEERGRLCARLKQLLHPGWAPPSAGMPGAARAQF